MLEVAALPVLNAWHHLALGRATAVALVGDDHARHVVSPLGELVKTCLRRLLAPSALDQHVEGIVVLIDGPPPIMAGTVDRQTRLVEGPRVTRSGTPVTPLVRIRRAECSPPLPSCFV